MPRSKIMEYNLTGTLIRPMLTLPDQKGLLGIGAFFVFVVSSVASLGFSVCRAVVLLVFLVFFSKVSCLQGLRVIKNVFPRVFVESWDILNIELGWFYVFL